MTAPALAPGIHRGISAEDYHALPLCSNSRLTLLKRSAARLQAHLRNPPAPTPDMRRGTAIHSYVLEPETFGARYATAGQCRALKKSGEPCTNGGVRRVDGEWRCGVHPLDRGRHDLIEVLPAADLAVCEGIDTSVRGDPYVGKLFAGRGLNELTVIWDDPTTGVRCKARIDRLSERAGRVIVDLKSVEDAREDAWRRTNGVRGYHRQLAMYEAGLAAHGVEVSHCVFVLAEKEPPFEVCGYRMSELDRRIGREEVAELMARYAECERSGVWPGYAQEIREVPSLPDWYYREHLYLGEQ